MRYKRTSNLRETPYEARNLGLYEPPFVPDFEQTDEIVITQKYEKRPDLLAHDLYGESKYWWVFVLYNRNQLQDPINDFVIGTLLLVPTRNYIAGL